VSEAVFVPSDFAVPHRLDAEQFRLEPLGPQHNVADYAAWTSSMEHIHATPGFTATRWPRPMTLAENLDDLERHAKDFRERRGFTYTVLDSTTGDVIGCVYIYPPRGGATGERRVTVESWVRADHAALDPVLYHAVRNWVERDWPFASIEYAPRN
jgi:hypothetical protein